MLLPEPDLFNYRQGEVLKKEGAERVVDSEGTWKARALAVVKHISETHPCFTADDIRYHASAKGIGDPRHQNSWGAILMACSKRGMIEKTGKYKKSTFKSNHARMIPEWTKKL